jgi:hypothetical protein
MLFVSAVLLPLAVAMFHLGRCLDARRSLTTLLQVNSTAAAAAATSTTYQQCQQQQQLLQDDDVLFAMQAQAGRCEVQQHTVDAGCVSHSVSYAGNPAT